MAAVLQVTPRLDAGGVERTTIEVAEALAAAGHSALVATAGGRLLRELATVGGRPIAMPVDSKNPVTVLRNAGRIAALCREERVALIHARSRAPAWSALIAARRLKLPFVTTYHGIYNARSRLKRLYNSVMARGDVVIANSEFTCRHVRATYDLPAERVATIPRGVDLAQFDPAAVEPARIAAFRAGWAAPEDAGRMIVLAPARLTRWKGQVAMLQALALTQSERPGAIKLLLAGDPQGRREYAVELETLIQKRGLRGLAQLLGHVGDMPAAYAAADAGLFASLEPEAFGRGAVEAQAMGLPVVVTAHGGFTETVVHNETGYHVAPGEVEALAETLVRLYDLGPQARRDMGARGAARARPLYAKTRLQADTLAVYARLIGPSAFPVAGGADVLLAGGPA